MARNDNSEFLLERLRLELTGNTFWQQGTARDIEEATGYATLLGGVHNHKGWHNCTLRRLWVYLWYYVRKDKKKSVSTLVNV